MADFRKWLLVLAIAVFAVSASAQTCTFLGANAPYLRDGSLAERVGEVALSCTAPAADRTVTFSVFLNNPVTNDFTDSSVNLPAAIVKNVGTGAIVSGVAGTSVSANSLQFSVTLPAGTTTTVSFVNIRVAVPAAADVNAAPPAVTETILSGDVPVSGLATPATVGYVVKSFGFAVTNCAGTTDANPANNTTFQQCVTRPGSVSGSDQPLDFAVQFTEKFSTAFKMVGDSATITDPAIASPNTESGYTVGAVKDQAKTGTRFIVKFTNIPTGVGVNVTTTNIAPSGIGVAQLVKGADINGVGGTVGGSTVVGSATCTVGGPYDVAAASTSGTTRYAVYEVTTSDPNANDKMTFGAQVKYSGLTSQALSSAQVSGLLGPQFASAMDISQYPAFGGNATVAATTGFTFTPCVTNLLFPYVTAQQGYTTGIALVNTSKGNATGADGTPANAPFNMTAQQGACHLYFFGNQDVAPQDTAVIPGGSLVKFTLTDVPTGWPSLADFEGYIIARCDFQFAHGFAFIVDGTVPGFGSEAYLAMVIPDRGANGRTADPFDAGPGAGAGTGEQLLH